MKRVLIGVFFLGGAAGAVMQACGGSTDSGVGPSDASTDGSMTGDGSMNGDGNTGVDADDSGPADSGIPCAPPTDGTKSSLCIRVAPEAIQFLMNDPNFDGKGIMVIDIHDMANPDAPDGAALPGLQTVVLPAQDGGVDAGELDLSMPVPTIRFDGLPAMVVYPRVLFVDVKNPSRSVGAGWWLGGYDLSNGLVSPVLLKPITLTPGKGTTVTIDLTALRRMVITLTRSATPIGNAMGPATVVATPDLVPHMGSSIFGAGSSACANVSGTRTADVPGFVFGVGPYYASAFVDDFGVGGSLPPGSLTSLEFSDGGIRNPPSTQLMYPANAYLVTHTVDLDLAIPKPDAGTDNVVCP